MPLHIPRRRLLALTAGLALPVAAAGITGLGRPWLAQAAAPVTPRFTPGPFYPRGGERFADTDWDLVRVEGAVRASGGTVMELTGRVIDPGGRPHAGARIEIWQCDHDGAYLQQRDLARGGSDSGFQGFGVAGADGEGRYRFRTIRPVPYPGRTPHIHARVVLTDGRELITQLFMADEQRNDGDFLFRRLDAGERRAVLVDVQPGGPSAPGAVAGRFDFVI